MSTPANTDTPSYETKVNELVSTMATEGWQAPADLDPGLLFAANAEKRRRDTQSEFTKSQQQLKAAELKATRLTEKLEAAVMESLPLKQQSRLEELKATDPDLWRSEIEKLENNARGDLAKELDVIAKESSNLTERDQRLQLLDQFLTANPGVTAEMIDEDVPPRITKKLADGKVTFEEFLAESVKFLTAAKVIDQGAAAPNLVDLGKASGGSKPGENDKNSSYNASYASEVY